MYVRPSKVRRRCTVLSDNVGARWGGGGLSSQRPPPPLDPPLACIIDLCFGDEVQTPNALGKSSTRSTGCILKKSQGTTSEVNLRRCSCRQIWLLSNRNYSKDAIRQRSIESRHDPLLRPPILAELLRLY